MSDWVTIFNRISPANIGFYSLLILVIPNLTGLQSDDVRLKIAQGASEQVGITTIYAPGYYRLDYPGGDIPSDRGVCADIVIRAFRKIGVDLQKEIHEDMTKNFHKYPNFWKMKSPDSNIDHRRVPNLMKFFKRKGKSVSPDSDYRPGDIVAWQLKYGLFHIGIVSAVKVPGKNRYFMVHNIGEGAKKEDILYEFKIIGHYRW
jgi:uncharacterized protein YijF (DUF1287 family)